MIYSYSVSTAICAVSTILCSARSGILGILWGKPTCPGKKSYLDGFSQNAEKQKVLP